MSRHPRHHATANACTDLPASFPQVCMYNTDDSIIGFAHASFKMAISKKMPLVRVKS